MNSGQVCLCLKRIYIHESIYEEFRDALIQHVKTLKVGDGSVHGVTHGPLQNAMQYERVQGFFADIETQKWNVAIGGKIEPSKGYFVSPTIIDNPPDDSRIVVEEPFGTWNMVQHQASILTQLRSYCPNFVVEVARRSHSKGQ